MGRSGPHRLLAFELGIECFGAEGTFCLNSRLYRIATIAFEHAAMPFPTANLILQAPELASPQGVEIHRDNRCIMGEMLEYAPIPAHMLAQHRLAIVLVAAPQDMVMSARYDANGIDLDETQPLYHRIEIDRASRRLRQSLSGQPKPTGQTIRYAKL